MLFEQVGVHNYLFVSGTADYQSNLRLAQESDKHGDLVIGGFIDSAENRDVGGHATGLRFVAECLSGVYPSETLVGLSTSTVPNFHQLSSLLLELGESPWTAANWDANNTRIVASDGAGIVANWVVLGQDVNALSNSYLLRIRDSKTLVDYLLNLHDRWWTAPTDAGEDDSDSAAGVQGAVEAASGSDSGYRAGSEAGLRFTGGGYFIPPESPVYDKSFMAVLGLAAKETGLNILSTDKFWTDKQTPCFSKWTNCICSGWLTTEVVDPADAEAITRTVHEKCPPETFDLDAPSKNGLQGTPLRGPAFPEVVFEAVGLCATLPRTAILLFSKPTDSKQRTRARTQLHTITGGRVKPVFPLGRVDGAWGLEVDRRLRREQAEFNDLLIGNYYDSYETLSSKTAMGLQWASDCMKENSKVLWVVKTDVDMVVNYPLLNQILDSIVDQGLDPKNGLIGGSESTGEESASDKELWRVQENTFWMGNVWSDNSVPVIKDLTVKNADALALDFYPAYVSGGFYVMNRNMTELFVKGRTKWFDAYFRNEDAMVGLVTNEFKIQPLHLHGVLAVGFGMTDNVVCKQGSISLTDCDCHSLLCFSGTKNENEIAASFVDLCDWSESYTLKTILPLERQHMDVATALNALAKASKETKTVHLTPSNEIQAMQKRMEGFLPTGSTTPPPSGRIEDAHYEGPDSGGPWSIA
ncbi:galactosyltransferase [Gregarina niphandrodes]|uniref:Galactosyltransferase n=1 Tax=Gregarina niphandrodes TaxID=110365 RepID=A0A023B5I8_GRENI|nr:galactosyltransferase [Gregarina niphandrodes]EZG60710.1 galactosyltransferase [Gregarina niphandrodes]|eukprot:XP_011130819.1 galactosyltransferase [Gregarina niphandrodes]